MNCPHCGAIKEAKGGDMEMDDFGIKSSLLDELLGELDGVTAKNLKKPKAVSIEVIAAKPKAKDEEI